MQQLRQWMRHLVYPAAAILLLWAGVQVICDTYISDAGGRVLVVYDAEGSLADSTLADPDLRDCSKLTPSAENPSDQALIGICKAFIDHIQKHQGPVALIDLVNLHESKDAGQNLNSSKVYEQLAAKVAGGSPLGVISLLTSPDSQAVVRFCRSMQIPLLLAIAANNDLLSAGEDTSGIVFRMIPTNKQQAEDIVEWMKQKNLRRVAVFHEPNSFGEYLLRQMNSSLKIQDAAKHATDPKAPAYSPVIFHYEVREQTEFADLMPELWCDRIDGIVYLGFASRAADLLNKLKWYRTDPATTNCEVGGRQQRKSQSFDAITVLLSNGAYQEDLDNKDKFSFRFAAYVMSAAKLQPGQTTAAQYAYDSYKLMANFAGSKKAKDRGTLRAVFSNSYLESKTGHVYEFDKRGELKIEANNKYRAYMLAASRHEPTPGSKP